MKTDEANKIIANYMGEIKKKSTSQCSCCYCSKCNNYFSECWCDKYTDSLDSLIPVWEKLKEQHNIQFSLDSICDDAEYQGYYDMTFNNLPNLKTCSECKRVEGIYPSHQADNIKLAAAIATAKAIQALESE